MIEAATSEIPEDVNLIVVSRAEPPAAFARLQASEQLALVTWDELKLTLDEARAITAGKGKLSDDIVRELHQESDGWAAGFALMRERTRRTGLVNRVTHAQDMATVFNYFATQIFNDASVESRDILIRTAVLPRVTASLAKAISGNPNAGRLLEYLCRRNLFTERRLSKDETTYQYHALFRAFLQAQATQCYTPPEFTRVRQDAASLLEATGQTEEAVALYLETEDWNAASRLILRLSRPLDAQGRHQTLKEWIRHLPMSELDAEPWLSFWLGTCQLDVTPAQARVALEQAYGRFAANSDIEGQVRAIGAIIVTYILDYGHWERIDKWAERLQTLLEDSTASTVAHAHGANTLLIARMWRSTDMHALGRLAERIFPIVETDIDLNARIAVGSQLIFVYHWIGDLSRQQQIASIMPPLLDDAAVKPVAYASWCLKDPLNNRSILSE